MGLLPPRSGPPGPPPRPSAPPRPPTAADAIKIAHTAIDQMRRSVGSNPILAKFNCSLMVEIRIGPLLIAISRDLAEPPAPESTDEPSNPIAKLVISTGKKLLDLAAQVAEHGADAVTIGLGTPSLNIPGVEAGAQLNLTLSPK